MKGSRDFVEVKKRWSKRKHENIQIEDERYEQFVDDIDVKKKKG